MEATKTQGSKNPAVSCTDPKPCWILNCTPLHEHQKISSILAHSRVRRPRMYTASTTPHDIKWGAKTALNARSLFGQNAVRPLPLRKKKKPRSERRNNRGRGQLGGVPPNRSPNSALPHTGDGTGERRERLRWVSLIPLVAPSLCRVGIDGGDRGRLFCTYSIRFPRSCKRRCTRTVRCVCVASQ